MRKFTLLIASLFLTIGAMAQVTDLANLSDEKVYTIESARGFLIYSPDGDKLITTNGTSTQAAAKVKNSANTAQQFQIKTIDGQRYLYSVAAKKYLAEGNKFTDNATNALTIKESSDATFKWYLQVGSNGLNSQDPGQTSEGIMVNGWTTEDPGNRYRILDVEALNNYNVTEFTGPNGFNIARAYTASTPTRGNWTVKDDLSSFCSTTDAGQANDAANTKQHFAVISVDGVDFYLYSVAAQKFVNHDKSLSEAPQEPIQLTKGSGNNTGRVLVSFKGINNSNINLGGSSQMTIDNWNTIDDGNAILFTEAAKFDPTAAINAFYASKNILQTKIEELTVYLNNEGDKVGQYSNVDAIRTAVETAQVVLNAATSTDADYEEQIEILNALTLPTINLPVAGKVYTLRCNHENRILRAGNDNKMYYEADGYNKSNSLAAWVFEAGETAGTFKMKSLHTQLYVPAITNGQIIMSEEGADITIAKSPQTTGAVIFSTGGANGIHANSNPVIAYTNSAGANHYFIEEIESVSYTLTVGEAGYSTLYLGFDAVIPAEVEAYTVSTVGSDYAELASAEGVLAANTGILVKAAAGDYNFAYTTEATDVTESALEGTLYEKEISGYVLANHDDYGLGFYATEEGFVNNANKAYLPEQAQSSAAFYGFLFEGTTGVENVVVENGAEVIFDLTGRRIESINAAGIYIVNGKKVLVK